MNGGSFSMSGGAKLESCSATGNGGGIYFGTGNISVTTAGGKGDD